MKENHLANQVVSSMIDMSPNMNPARYPALQQATHRAEREGKAMHVYVGGPSTPHSFKKSGYNVWFVCAVDEPAPEGAELYQVVAPPDHAQQPS